MRVKFGLDDAIDSLVDEILGSIDTMPRAEFEAKLRELSLPTKLAVRAMVKEQILMEHDDTRKTQLRRLQTIITDVF